MRSKIAKIAFLAGLLFLAIAFWELNRLFSEVSHVAPASETPDISDWSPSDAIGLRQDDPVLIELIKTQLYPPSHQPYNLNKPELRDFSEYNQTGVNLKALFHEKKRGFFVDVGASDGELFSKSLYWEREHEWTGILIEPDPGNFENLLRKRRKSYLLHASLCPTKYANITSFQMDSGLMGRIITHKPMTPMQLKVPCYPLYSILAALGFPKVNFMSLDTEGREMEVLRTLPFRSVGFQVLMVKYNHIKEGLIGLQEFLHGKGYSLVGKVGVDGVFVHKSFVRTKAYEPFIVL